jgi:hypothetical protein
MSVVLFDDFEGTGAVNGRTLTTSSLGAATWIANPSDVQVANGEINADSVEEMIVGPMATAAPATAISVVFDVVSPETPGFWQIYFNFSSWDGTGEVFEADQISMQAFRTDADFRGFGYGGRINNANLDFINNDIPDLPASFPTPTALALEYDGSDLSLTADGVSLVSMPMTNYEFDRRYFTMYFVGLRLQSFTYLSPAAVESTDLVATSPAILGAARVLAFHDFTGQIGDVVTRYVMDLVTPTGTVRVPISSWQATLQTGRSNYVQCVVPAVLTWVTAINAATEFVVSRTATLPDGSVIEYEMARAPVGEARFDRGPTNYTCTLSGYSTGFAADEEPSAATDRVLAKVRSLSFGVGGRRVRCAVDWLLRPGQRAIVDDVPFTVAYINYYVGGGDAYMDAGERT